MSKEDSLLYKMSKSKSNNLKNYQSRYFLHNQGKEKKLGISNKKDII